MPSLTSVSGRFVAADNGLMEGQVKGSSLILSNLTSLFNCTFRHLMDLKAPSLAIAGASLSFDETRLARIDVPRITSVGQTLSIVSNDLLSNISFGELTMIEGTLLIANNTELTAVDGFPKLKGISGILNIRGAFTNITLPFVVRVNSPRWDVSVIQFRIRLVGVKANAHVKTICQVRVKPSKPTNNDGISLESGAEMTATITVWVPPLFLAA